MSSILTHALHTPRVRARMTTQDAGEIFYIFYFHWIVMVIIVEKVGIIIF